MIRLTALIILASALLSCGAGSYPTFENFKSIIVSRSEIELVVCEDVNEKRAFIDVSACVLNAYNSGHPLGVFSKSTGGDGGPDYASALTSDENGNYYYWTFSIAGPDIPGWEPGRYVTKELCLSPELVLFQIYPEAFSISCFENERDNIAVTKWEDW